MSRPLLDSGLFGETERQAPGLQNLFPVNSVTPNRPVYGIWEWGTGRKRNRTWSFEEESQFQEGVKNRTRLRGHSRSDKVGFA